MTGFKAEQRTSMDTIMQVVLNRFFDRRVHYNMVGVATRVRVSSDYFTKTRLPNNSRQLSDLLYAQKLALNTTGVPLINFTAYNEQSNYWANAEVGTVLTEFGVDKGGRTTVAVKGEYKINVNTFWLGGGGIRSDANVWAGVIAHEMLHSLGHTHDKDEYGDHLQINAFQQAVRANGLYRRASPVPPFRCGRG
jgi:hypothetical protein